MTSDTKAIIIAVITTGVAIIGVAKADNAALRTELKSDITEFQAAVESDFAEIRADIREIRTAVNANTAEIAEMRGALNAHIDGHNHAPKNSPTVASAE